MLVVLGVLFFFREQGLISGNIFKWFWPVFLIGLGTWIIIGVYRPADGLNNKTFSIPLQNAKEAKISFDHGAGQILVRGGAQGSDFMTGTEGRALEKHYSFNDDIISVKISAGPTFIPFVGPETGTWEFKLNPSIPIKMKLNAGASNIELDLRELLVPQLKLDTGASSTKITVPARGASFVDIQAGAASIDITIPSGVAARIRMKEGLASLDLDKSRFKEINSDLYQSPDFDSSKDRTEIEVQAGLASVKIN
jgi:hypothetical protein